MNPDHLKQVSQALQAAAEAASDDAARERLHEQSETFADLAAAERGPDHGRLARHENILHDVEDDVGDEAADHIQAAFTHIAAYREDLPGV